MQNCNNCKLSLVLPLALGLETLSKSSLTPVSNQSNLCFQTCTWQRIEELFLFFSAASAPKGYFSCRALIPWEDLHPSSTLHLHLLRLPRGLQHTGSSRRGTQPENTPKLASLQPSHGQHKHTWPLLFPYTSRPMFYQRANQNNNHSSLTITN